MIRFKVRARTKERVRYNIIFLLFIQSDDIIMADTLVCGPILSQESNWL